MPKISVSLWIWKFQHLTIRYWQYFYFCKASWVPTNWFKMPPLLAFWSSSLHFPRRKALFIFWKISDRSIGNNRFCSDENLFLVTELRIRTLYFHYPIRLVYRDENVPSDWIKKYTLKNTRKHRNSTRKKEESNECTHKHGESTIICSCSVLPVSFTLAEDFWFRIKSALCKITRSFQQQELTVPLNSAQWFHRQQWQSHTQYYSMILHRLTVLPYQHSEYSSSSFSHVFKYPSTVETKARYTQPDVVVISS